MFAYKLMKLSAQLSSDYCCVTADILTKLSQPCFLFFIVLKVCAQWRILKPPGSSLATDRSKAVVLV